MQKPRGTQGWAKHFFFWFLPALTSVVAGNIGFVGRSPQTRKDIEREAASASTIYLCRHPGIVSLDSLRTAVSGDLFAQADANKRKWSNTIAVLYNYALLVVKDLLLLGGRNGK